MEKGVEKCAEITAMTFDPSYRRLVTGGRDGSVKIWNFNNGACLRELETFDCMEVRKKITRCLFIANCSLELFLLLINL